jgi:hypothetical protein
VDNKTNVVKIYLQSERSDKLINLKLIKPKLANESDKYSWNIYRIFKKCEMEIKKSPPVTYKILYYQHEDDKKFDKSKTLNPYYTFIMKIYPCAQGSAGIRISEVMYLSPNSSIKFYCYDFSLDHSKFVDITQWFLKMYEDLGRCLFDREHTGIWGNDKQRFTKINSHSRRCNWCNQIQTRQIKKVVNIQRVAIWKQQF